jgi:hypothetical protein
LNVDSGLGRGSGRSRAIGYHPASPAGLAGASAARRRVKVLSRTRRWWLSRAARVLPLVSLENHAEDIVQHLDHLLGKQLIRAVNVCNPSTLRL